LTEHDVSGRVKALEALRDADVRQIERLDNHIRQLSEATNTLTGEVKVLSSKMTDLSSLPARVDENATAEQVNDALRKQKNEQQEEFRVHINTLVSRISMAVGGIVSLVTIGVQIWLNV